MESLCSLLTRRSRLRHDLAGVRRRSVMVMAHLADRVDGLLVLIAEVSDLKELKSDKNFPLDWLPTTD